MAYLPKRPGYLLYCRIEKSPEVEVDLLTWQFQNAYRRNLIQKSILKSMLKNTSDQLPNGYMRTKLTILRMNRLIQQKFIFLFI